MSPADSILLDQTERILRTHSPADFDTAIDAFPECIEYVRAVEDEEAWKARYPSLDAFYGAHEARHPDVRLYGEARRETLTGDPLSSPGGTPTQRLARLRNR